MAIRVNCPNCDTPHNVADDKAGRKIRCKECEEPILVPKPAAKKAAAEQIQAKRKVKTSSARMQDDEDEDEPPAKKSKKSAKEAKQGPSMLLVVGGVVAVLLVCVVGIGGTGAYFLFRGKPADNAIAKTDDKDKKEPAKNAEPEKQDNVVERGRKKEEEKPDPDVGKPLPPQLTAEMVQKTKQATVYLHVTMPTGITAEGSGFFAVEKGIVVTNAHVLGMLLGSSKPPKQVDVIQDSGLPTETRLAGEVLGVDRASDLAVIRVADNGKLPTPITLSGDAPSELQKVYIFGFPFGEKLGKNITISEQAIASLRPDVSGALDRIQCNGGMNPGNSGGPVVDTRGRLVGVSVSIISGAQISFAVPAEKVRKIMSGRVADQQHGEPYQQAGKAHLPVQLACLDPLNKIRELRVDVWTAPPGKARPASEQKPKEVPGDGPRQEHAVAYADGKGKANVPLPPLPGGHVYWMQPVVVSGAGTHWGMATPTTSDLLVLERKPADLTIDLNKHRERTAKVDCKLTITETFNKKDRSTVEHTAVELLEVLEQEPGRKGALIKTSIAGASVRVSLNGNNLKFSKDEFDALAISRGMAPVFVIDETNATSGYRKVSINPKHPRYYLKDLVELFNGMINNPFEATQFKMPNRVVNPQDTFTSQSTMMMRLGSATPVKGKAPQRATINDLKLVCTYEGIRTRNNREEAVLTVVGTLESRKDLANKVLGDVSGKIGFDVAGGFVSYAKVKIFAEAEENIPGLGTFRDTLSQEIELDRVAGNTKKLALVGPSAPPPPSKDKVVALSPAKDPTPGGPIANPAPKPIVDGDVTVRQLTFARGGAIVDDIVWARDGKSFYMLHDTGLLQRIDVATGQTQESLEIGARSSALAMCSEGLLIASQGAGHLFVVDPDKLGTIKKKIAIPGIVRVSAGRDATVVWAGVPNTNGRGLALRAVDAKEGTVLKTHQNSEIWVYGASPDGKYVFTASDEGLTRFRIERDNLIREDVSFRIGGNNTRRICFSPDSKFVAMPAGAGNGSGHKDHPPLKTYSTYVYPVDNLKRPAAAYAGGPFPRAVGIDTKSNCILAQNFSRPLLVFSFGVNNKIAEYDFKPMKNFATTEFSISPLGSEVILRSENHGIIHVKINKPGPAISQLQQKPAQTPTLARADEFRTSLAVSRRDP